MPRVPTYDTQPLQPTVRQGGARPVLGVEQAALPGQQIEQAGRQLSRAAGAVGEYVLRQQNEINEVRANDTINKVEAEFNRLAAEYGEMRGINAIENEQVFGNTDPISYHAERAREVLQKVTTDLPEPVKLAVRNALQRQAMRLEDRVTQHFTAQNREYATTVRQTTVQQAGDALMLDPTPDNVLAQTNRMAATLEAQGRADGLAGEPLQAYVNEAVGAQYARVVEARLDQNDARGAQAFLEQYGERIAPDDRAKLAGVTQRAMASTLGAEDAGAVLARFPVQRNDTNNLARDDALRAAATVNGVLDEARYQASRAVLGRKVSLREEDQRGRAAREYDGLVQLGQRDLGAALASPAFARLSPSEQNSFVNSFVSGRDSPEQQLAYVQLVQDPAYMDRLGNMTPGQLAELRPVLGEQRFAEVQRDWTSVQRQAEATSKARAELRNPTIFDNTLKLVAQTYGLEASGEDGVVLKDRMISLVAAEQQRLGRELARDEMQEFLMRAFAGEVRLGRGLFSSTQRAAVIEPDQLRRVQVPTADEQRIRVALRDSYRAAVASGDPNAEALNPDVPENVARAYVDEQVTGQRMQSQARAPEFMAIEADVRTVLRTRLGREPTQNEVNQEVARVMGG